MMAKYNKPNKVAVVNKVLQIKVGAMMMIMIIIIQMMTKLKNIKKKLKNIKEKYFS
jgi:hypothetical protein